jgi:beta-1,4-mannosyltransferase
VLFMPDWRRGNSYQQLLAEALAGEGVVAEFPRGYRRGLPLTRLVHDSQADLIHLHWPEAYFGKGLRLYRTMRFPLDLSLATLGRPLVYTAHNLMPHRDEGRRLVRAAYQSVLRRARAVFVHSATAAQQLSAMYAGLTISPALIPHGDLSVELAPPLTRREARRELDLGDGPLCVMFGVVDQYKGIEDVLRYWIEAKPEAELAVVGNPSSQGYARSLLERASRQSKIRLAFGWLSLPQLRAWLSAADVAIFNYVRCLTSGSAALARSFGVPILLPRRLDSIDLAEPNARVFRFESTASDFERCLREALAVGADYHSAADWRAATRWSRVAAITAAAYREVLQRPPPLVEQTPLPRRREKVT